MTRLPRPDPRLQRLVALTGAVRQAELAKFGRLAAQADLLRGQIAALDQPVTGAEELPLAARAGIEARYRLWAEDRRRTLNLQLARQMAQIETMRARCAHAVGRDDVLTKLLAQHRPGS